MKQMLEYLRVPAEGRRGGGEKRHEDIGVDPGVATIGFGLIEADRGSQRLLRYGVINTPAGLPLSNRLYQISRDMEELLGAFHPDEAAVEELFFSKNITTGIAVAHGRGVILLELERAGIPVYEYTPMQVKQAVAGYGGAEKRQVMLMTQRLLKMEEIPGQTTPPTPWPSPSATVAAPPAC